MTFVCDGCDQEIREWGVRLAIARDYDPEQPDAPRFADQKTAHLCTECRPDLLDNLGIGQ